MISNESGSNTMSRPTQAHWEAG